MGLIPSLDTTIFLISIAISFFITASILYFIRLVKGPTLPDIVLAIDVLSYDLAVFIIAFSIACRSPLLAVGALPLVLWAYLLDMYVSKYFMRKELGD